MTLPTHLAIAWTERGLLPDPLVRAGIRKLLRERLDELGGDDPGVAQARTEAFVAHMRSAPIALLPEQANAQHYEVPDELFAAVLGRHLKYSCGYWPEGIDDLDRAEAAALEATVARAGIADGMRVLELGCGWGSLTLWMAERFPNARITAVSNSRTQRAHIGRELMRRGLANVEVVTADMNTFDPAQRFDRVVSVEMFEHMRNWPRLFARIHDWLLPHGRFFMHVFCHREVPYAFEVRDASDWMSEHFFSGGMMPSDALAARFQDHLRLRQHWRWDGTHYQKTAEAWLANMDRRRGELWPLFEATYGPQEAPRWWSRWRLFFLACAELWGFREGREWWVAHYFFERREG